MRFTSSRRRPNSFSSGQSTKFRYERLEDRQMLAADADIVFIIDESLSDETASVQIWLAAMIDELDAALQANAINTQYGLMGFGEDDGPVHRYAHSQPVDGQLFSNDFNELFAAIANNLSNEGGEEDGWDAFEHVIAEYDFRHGAVPIIVFIQNDEGRIDFNDTLTRPGVLAALQSKNVILNSMIVGESLYDHLNTPSYDDDIFDYEPAFLVDGFGGRVLGIEADTVDNALDQIHTYYGYNSGMTTGEFEPATDTLAGSTSLWNELAYPNTAYDQGLTETNDSYIRMAWDTGGAAWDIGIIDEYGGNSAQANALRDAFFESLGNQINRAHEQGNLFRADQVLLALDLGNTSADINAGTAGLFRRDNGTYTAPVGGGADTGAAAVESGTGGASVDVDKTNSVPLDTSKTSEMVNIFKSYRGELNTHTGDHNVSFTIDKLDINNTVTTLANGTYIVELFFAEVGGSSTRIFDVQLEGQTMLNDYDIYNDRARINESFDPGVEHNSEQAMANTGLVKRFEIDVTGGDGLQIDLIREAGLDPILSAVRILRADAPRVTNVTISGTASTHDPFSFNGPNDATDFDGSGIQLKTVPVGGADTISIQFSEHMNVTSGSLTLVGLRYGVAPNLDNFDYDPQTFTATWEFDAVLTKDQYSILLNDDIEDEAENQLDGEWTNPFRISTTHADVSEFPSGDGIAGGDFNFVFTILPGDGDLSNGVSGRDFLLWQRSIGGETFAQCDYNGDGTTDGADNAFWQANYGIYLDELIYADFNNDGVVDGLDEDIWDTWQGTGTTHGQGDADGDGDVDNDDFDIWDAQFGLELDWVA